MNKIYKDAKDTKLEATFMSDEALCEFLDARVVVCSDVMLYNRKKESVYLATRKHKPAEGPWVIGGQTKRGEKAKDTACRRLKAETSIDIDPQRLEYLTTAEYIWSYRAEPESTNGRHDLARTFALEITDEERGIIAQNLDQKEYEVKDGLKAYTHDDLIAANVRSCLIDYYNLIFQK